MKFLLRGLYAHNGLFYFYTRIDNDTNMPFAVDFVTFKVVDKKVAEAHCDAGTSASNRFVLIINYWR